jgi:hypothetical protein
LAVEVAVVVVVVCHGYPGGVASGLFLGVCWPDKGLRDDYSFAVERGCRAAMEAESKVDGLADPAAEGVVVGSG